MIYTEKQLKIAKLNKILRLIALFDKADDATDDGETLVILKEPEDCGEVYDFLVESFEDTAADLIEFLKSRMED